MTKEQLERKKETNRLYRQRPENKEKMKLYNKNYILSQEQKEKQKDRKRLWYDNPENKEKMRLYNENYKSSEEVKERQKQSSKKYSQKSEVKERRKANKDGIIYTITNLLGQVYIGATKMLPHVRWNHHKTNFTKIKKNKLKLIPLHQSFDKWGVDTHLFTVIKNYGDINKKELLEIEGNMIKHLNSNGKSLNIRKI